MNRRSDKRERSWNAPRRRVIGRRLLRLSGAHDLAGAIALLKDSQAPIQRRCLAARAIGLLGDESAGICLEECDPRNESPFGRACYRALADWYCRRTAERRWAARQQADEKLRQMGLASPEGVIPKLLDRSAPAEIREAAAAILGGLRYRQAVTPLVQVLAEGHQNLSWVCMSALTAIGSRRGCRQLIAIAGGNYLLPARQEAVYALWMLREHRAESLFVRLGRAIGQEEEYTRDMATEALGNTSLHHKSQQALAERLFDPSPSVRYAALCACSTMFPQPFPFPDFLRRALIAKLGDPARLDDDRIVATAAAQLLGVSPTVPPQNQSLR